MLYIDSDGYRLSQTEKRQLENALISVISGDTHVDELLTRRRKSCSKLQTSANVTVLEDVSEHDTVLEIRAADRPGLLYYLTRKMSELGWNIHSARVATWNHEARDVFYVTDRTNNKLDSRQIERLSKALGSHDHRTHSDGR
jgi:[protein-PII] uridylyltransferase